MKSETPKFEKEVDLCTTFIERLPKEWTAYAETGGFDILLVRNVDGFQVGIEAKLKLNAKVVSQVAEMQHSYHLTYPGPDCRAVLVPAYASSDMAAICRILSITVIRVPHPDEQGYYGRYNRNKFSPELPHVDDRDYGDSWHLFCPQKRLKIPDWVPDVKAGCSSPNQLSFWKIGAIKICIVMERRGHLTRADFKNYEISMSRWTQGHWIVNDGNGKWLKGPNFPDLRPVHPINYGQIEADHDKWRVPE